LLVSGIKVCELIRVNHIPHVISAMYLFKILLKTDVFVTWHRKLRL
jgi:hypothetical protein